MTNLIYIDEEYFASNSFSSKIKYLVFEFGFYFDGSEQLRTLGYTIGSGLFATTSTYTALMNFKRNYTLFLRVLMLLVTLGVAGLILVVASGFLATIVSFFLVTGGVILFLTFLTQRELEIIDRSYGRFVEGRKGCPTSPLSSIGVITFIGDSNHGSCCRDLSEEQFKLEVNRLQKRGRDFLGFPIGLLEGLLVPLLAPPFNMERRQLLNVIRNLVDNTDADAFHIPRGKVENFKTFFYCVYQYLDSVHYRFLNQKDWSKGVFCKRLFNCFLNLRELRVEDLRVHPNKIEFAIKMEKHFRTIDSHRYTNT